MHVGVVIDPLVCYRDAGRSAVRHGGLVNACTAGDMDVFDALLMVRAAAAAGRVMSRALCDSVACGAAGIMDRHAGEFGKMLVLQNSAGRHPIRD